MTDSSWRRPRVGDEAPIDLVSNIPFLSVHLGCLLLFWTGIGPVAAAVGLVSLAVRMFGLTGGYHRYFCHRSYETGRAFQFVLGWIGASAAQMGPLWWASHHRHHHREADTEGDVHPPGVKGFFWAHMGWVMSPSNADTDYSRVSDLAVYPELRWLNRYHWVPPLLLAVGLWGLGTYLAAAWPQAATSGLQMLAVGFFLSTTLLYHVTFAVNSLGHTLGGRRYDTRENSRNSLLLALVTGGEGWHNNHHRYPGSERQGFYWWEIDLTHYALVALSWIGLVRNLRGPSPEVLEEGRSAGSRDRIREIT